MTTLSPCTAGVVRRGCSKIGVRMFKYGGFLGWNMERQYQIRFHLAKGKNFMKFQVKNLKTGEVEYFDPDTTSLVLYDCVLKNQKTTAQKINCGANKTVCAWVRASKVIFLNTKTTLGKEYEVGYNPRIAPYWRDFEGNDIDNESFGEIRTMGRSLFANPNY